MAGYDYWALGHIHARRVLCERPWIVFPGNLQGRHAKETGAKGCTLVTVEDRRIVAIEHRSVDVLRWARVERDITGCGVTPQFHTHLEEAALQALAEAEGRPVLLRLVLTGTTPLHGRLMEDAEGIAAECRQAALLSGGDLWVESVRSDTRPVAAARADLLRPLRHAYFSGLDDPPLVRALLDEMQRVRQKLPAAARDEVELPADETELRRIAGDAWASLEETLAVEDPA